MADKNINEMSVKELREEKKNVEKDVDEIQTKLANKTVRMVFGRKIESQVKINDKKMDATEWKDSRECEVIALEMVENHSILVGSMFDFERKSNVVIDEEVVANCKALGIDKKAFWIAWDVHKLIMRAAYLEKINSEIDNKVNKKTGVTVKK